MTYQTAVLSSFEEYLAVDDDPLEERDRNSRLLRFPFSIMLKVSFAELDFANRWCWQQFGPGDGECMQRESEYRACDVSEPHSHVGTWTSHWFVKTEYNFGFNEWYFAECVARDRFLAHVEALNWGEHYPK